MTDPVKEQLSACLDGELPESELGLLLKQLQRDRQLLQSMGSYALIGEAMRGARPVNASSGFADRVAAAIAAEPASEAPSRVSPAAVPRWLRPAAGIAIAAGVAAVAIVALQPPTVETQQIAATTESTSMDATEIAPSYTVPTNIDPTPGSAFIPAARLTNYVVAHSEFSSPLGRRTVLSGVLSDDQTEEDDTSPESDQSSASSQSPEVTQVRTGSQR